jgi:hypothetical protein
MNRSRPRRSFGGGPGSSSGHATTDVDAAAAAATPLGRHLKRFASNREVARGGTVTPGELPAVALRPTPCRALESGGEGSRAPAAPSQPSQPSSGEEVDRHEERLLRAWLNALLVDRGVRVSSLFDAGMCMVCRAGRGHVQ